MKLSNNIILIGLKIIGWIIFVGLSIEAGGVIVNFIFSIFKPTVLHLLYQKLDINIIKQDNPLLFYLLYSFLIAVTVLKSLLFYNVILLLRHLDLQKPFDPFISKQIMRLSYFTFSIGIISEIAHHLTSFALKYGNDVAYLSAYWAEKNAFITMSAIIYIIAVVFKKGVELQNENDLTV